MAERFIKKTIKTDLVGDYVEYEYADGHRETDPPNRPKSREDVQRERLQEAAGVKAQRNLEQQRSKNSAYGNTPSHIVRENLTAVSGRDLVAPYHATLHALETVSETIRGPEGSAEFLIDNYDLGGVVEGDVRGEYGFPTPPRPDDDGRPGVRERRYPGRLR